jgi:hypothetical protein
VIINLMTAKTFGLNIPLRCRSAAPIEYWQLSASGTKRTIAALQQFVRYWTRADKPQCVLYECAQLAVVNFPV